MTQDWDDILSEPIGLLQPDLPAAEGGWRAVSPLDKVSPRPQQALQTLPDPDGMLSFPVPEQPMEEPAGPAWLEAPSLTEQLSLTWASRRQRRRPATQDAPDVSWPAWEPAAAPATETPTMEPTGPTWLQPLRRLITRFRRKEAMQAVPAVKPQTVRIDEPVPEAPPETPSPARQEVPLTFARARREDPVPPPSTAPIAPAPDATTNAEARTPPILAQATPPPPRSESTRQQPSGGPGVKPPAETPRFEVPEVSDKLAEPGFPEVPLVDRTPRPETESPALPAKESPRAPAAGQTSTKQETTDDGEPLSPVLRERMETLLDVPLGQVRVFRNSIARQVTREHAAEAVTVANDVYVAPGRGEPSTPSGQALLAHELSHVAARQAGSEPSPAEETRAQALEHAVASPAAPARPRAVPMAGPALDHRLSPVHGAMRSQAGAHINGSAAGVRGAGVGSGPGPGAASSHVLATAPLDRIPAPLSEPALAPMADGASPPIPETSPEATDEASLVDRVVDAVLRRLRRESALERERRGAFRSEIGG